MSSHLHSNSSFLRILYISHTHPPQGTILDNVGGMQRVSRQLIDELRRCDDVEVFTETTNVFGPGLLALKTTAYLLRMLWQLPRLVRRHDADVILFSSMVTASLARFLRKRINIPMVTINHGRDVTLESSIYQRFLPGVFRALDGVISVSRATRQQCIDRGMPPAKGVALPNGFNMSTMKSLPEKGEARARLQESFGIPLDDRFMLLTVGRMVERKGHEWFIREVLPEINPKVAYVVIGDGPREEDIQEAVRQSTEERDIFLLGRQPDAVLKQAYAAADLFIMPNVPVEGDMEGFGIVLLEANMAGAPAVASDLEGIKDVIAQGENGYRVPPLQAGQFAAKVNEVLADNLEHLSARARTYVKQQFSWQKVAQQYIQYLKEVADRYTSDQSKI